MNPIENKENNVLDLRFQNLTENITGNIRTIEFCKNLDEEKTKNLNYILAQFLSPQNKLETV